MNIYVISYRTTFINFQYKRRTFSQKLVEQHPINTNCKIYNFMSFSCLHLIHDDLFKTCLIHLYLVLNNPETNDNSLCENYW